MIDKDPTSWAHTTWLLAIGMAVGGGFINWYSKVKRGHARLFNFAELVGEILVSAIVGVGTFMVLAAYEQPMGVCAGAAGVGGHMGTRLLFLLENKLEEITELKKLKKQESEK